MDGDMIHRTPTATPSPGVSSWVAAKGGIDTVVDKPFCKRQQTLPRTSQPDCPTLFGAPSEEGGGHRGAHVSGRQRWSKLDEWLGAEKDEMTAPQTVVSLVPARRVPSSGLER